MARYYWIGVLVIIFLCAASSTAAVHNTTACWHTGFMKFDIECRVGVIAIISSTSSHSTCDMSGGCCILREDCTVVSPDIVMTNIYRDCEGQQACSVTMTMVNPLEGCEAASNYQVVYYGCTSSTTKGAELSTSRQETVSTSSYIFAGTTSTSSTTEGVELSTSWLETISTSSYMYVVAGTTSTSSPTEGTSSEVSTSWLKTVSITNRYVSVEKTSPHTSRLDQESSSLTSTTPTAYITTLNADIPPDSLNIGLILGCILAVVVTIVLVGFGIIIGRKCCSADNKNRDICIDHGRGTIGETSI